MTTVNWVGSYRLDDDTGRVYRIVRTWDDTEMVVEFGVEDMTAFAEIARKPSRRAPGKSRVLARWRSLVIIHPILL